MDAAEAKKLLRTIYAPHLERVLKRRVLVEKGREKPAVGSFIPLSAVSVHLRAGMSKNVPEGQEVAGWDANDLDPRDLAFLIMIKEHNHG